MVKKNELSAKQKRCIVALISCRNIGEAIEAAGICRTTLSRWLEQPHFTAALAAAEGNILKQASAALTAGQLEAIETIRNLMTARNTTAAIRLRAANDYLNLGFKLRELSSIEQRLTDLEKAVNYENK